MIYVRTYVLTHKLGTYLQQVLMQPFYWKWVRGTFEILKVAHKENIEKKPCSKVRFLKLRTVASYSNSPAKKYQQH